MKRMKTGVQFKIAAGYTLAILVLALAVWLVYGNTRAFMQIDKAEREFMERRDVVDSLIYCFLETDNCERSLCLGNTDELDNFDASLRKTMALADSLKAMVSDSSQCLKIDSLRSMLLLKRENTLMIVDEMARNNPDKFFREKVIKLQEGQDSVVIHPKSVEVQENKEVVYDIVKSKKGFFARLADAFRKQHADTIQVSNRSRKAVTDSARHSINIADTVAGVLKEIKREELKARRARQEQLDEKRQTQQLVGVQLARRIEQLLEDIRDEEHRALQAAIDTDLSGRRSVMLKIISLALVAVMSAVVLLLYVRRDMRKARIYNENLERAKAETERIMAQRERLLLTITHDIKAPAASISGFIELLGEYVRDGKAASYLSNIKNSATHLLHLVSALLDYHRLESGKVETRSVSFSPRQLVDCCAEGIRPQAGAKGLAVESDTSGCGSRLCLGDAFRIKQILDNIISNALKYTDQGSIAISARMQGSRLQVDVADTGRGMTPEEARRIFNAFTRLPGAQGTEGVGLGHDFLRHIDRCRLLVHLVDVSGSEGRDPIADFDAINQELRQYSPELADRPQIVVANKTDLLADPAQLDAFRAHVEEAGYTFMAMSAATHQGTRELVQAIAARLAELPPVAVYEPEYVPRPPQIDTSEPLNIQQEDNTWLVEGPWLQRLMANINFSDYESRMYFDKMLRQSGLFDQLERMGIQDGDIVSMYNLEFEYQR